VIGIRPEIFGDRLLRKFLPNWGERSIRKSSSNPINPWSKAASWRRKMARPLWTFNRSTTEAPPWQDVGGNQQLAYRQSASAASIAEIVRDGVAKNGLSPLNLCSTMLTVKVMINTYHEKSQRVQEIVRGAARIYSDNPSDALVAATDQLVRAAVRTRRLCLKAGPNGILVVIIGDDDEIFDVKLPCDNGSSFRAILARIGVICHATARKHSFQGRMRALLIRFGLGADRFLIEQKDAPIRYLRAVLRKQPGSPLYRVDAELEVQEEGGVVKLLHVHMENSPNNLFLTFRQPNKCQRP
jgi:hypothetical protein